METYFNNLTTDEGGHKQLLQDIKNLIEEAEGLIKNTAEDLPENSKKELLERLERLKKSSETTLIQFYKFNAAAKLKNTETFLYKKMPGHNTWDVKN